MADTFFVVSILSFILSGIFLLLAVFFWLRFDILEVIGNLSGRTARKNIEKRRASNEKNGAMPVHSEKKTQEKGIFSKKPAKSVKMMTVSKIEQTEDTHPETGLLSENIAVFEKEIQTDILAGDVTGELIADETSLLAPAGKAPVLQGQTAPKKRLTMLDDLIVIHTEEVIR